MISIKSVMVAASASLISLFLIPASALAQWGRYDGWHMGSGMMGGWGMGWFGAFL